MENINVELPQLSSDLNDLFTNQNVIYSPELRVSDANLYQLNFSRGFDLLKTNSVFLNRFNGLIEKTEDKEYEILDYVCHDLKNTIEEFSDLDFAKLKGTKIYFQNIQFAHENLKNILDDILLIENDKKYVFYIQSMTNPFIYDLIYILSTIFRNISLVKDNDWLKDTFKIYCSETYNLKKGLKNIKILLNSFRKKKNEIQLPYRIYHSIPEPIKTEIIQFVSECFKKIIYLISLIYESFKTSTYVNKYEIMLKKLSIQIS